MRYETQVSGAHTRPAESSFTFVMTVRRKSFSLCATTSSQNPGAEGKRRLLTCRFFLRIPVDRAPGGLCFSRHLPSANDLGFSLGSFSKAMRRQVFPQGFQPRRGATRPGRGRGREAPPTAPAWIWKGFRDRCWAEIWLFIISHLPTTRSQLERFTAWGRD